MLQAKHVTLQRGAQQLFQDLSFTVHPGHKLGVVGRNGAGKSTLFALLTGEVQADDGELGMPPGWRIGHMAQQVYASSRRALDYVIDGHHELRATEAQLAATAPDQSTRLAELHTRLDDLGGHQAEARAGEILHGLGFAASDHQRPFDTFSGGMRIRLNLARTLMAPADLLLLDEPTNHLDLETTLWLEGWLKRFQGTLLLIAHDRELLDAVCDQILYLERGTATGYRGNYSSFERQRAQQLALQQAAATKQQHKIKQISDFVARFRAKASKARQAQSRLRALERMEKIAPVHAASPYRFTIAAPQKISNPLLRLEAVAIGYASGPVLSDVSASILPGDRIGILGANGAGKSTLLKCLVGELEPQQGSLIRGKHAQTGYFAQHQLETLDGSSSPLGLLEALKGETTQWCRDYLGGWGFSGDLSQRPIHTLSGGEKARLRLALIALETPGLLVLDEPTNHLDLDMREALALALQDYEGAVVLVSHDRSLLERTVDEYWIVANGELTRSNQTLESYAKPDLEAPKSASGKRATRQAAAARRAREKPHRMRLAQLETDMERMRRDLTQAEVTLADPEVYQRMSTEALDGLLSEAGRLRKQLAQAELEWLEAAETLENLS